MTGEKGAKVETKGLDESPLTDEEKELLESVERGEWRRVDDFVTEKKRYEQYARGMFKKDARINIRISSSDLMAVKKKALIEGIPYQTLIASVIHKFVSGRFKECD